MGRSFHCQDSGRPPSGPPRLNLRWEMGGVTERDVTSFPDLSSLGQSGEQPLLTAYNWLGTGVSFHLPGHPLSRGLTRFLGG